jgi:four helix bundle protein
VGTGRFHEDLDAYRLARQLAIDLFGLTAAFPPAERLGLTAQIRRSSVSIAANIAEGAARGSPREFARFLRTARGSAAELRVLLDIAVETGCGTREAIGPSQAAVDRVLPILSGLIRRAVRPRGL